MPKGDAQKKLTRDERLAEQLRANLRRRKTAAKRQKSKVSNALNSAKPNDEK